MNADKLLKDIGETFGKAISELIRENRAYSCNIDSVTDEIAYVVIAGSTEPQPVPLTGICIPTAAFKFKPNVGSLAIIQFANGDNTKPFFIAFSEIDFFSFKRGTTELSWEITPPTRSDDDDQTEQDGETNDVINLTVGDSTLKIDTNIWEFNGGTLGGLAVVASLAQKYNDLKAAFESFKSNYNSHIHTTTATVGATPTPGIISATLAQETTVITTVTVEDIQNEKIKQ